MIQPHSFCSVEGSSGLRSEQLVEMIQVVAGVRGTGLTRRAGGTGGWTLDRQEEQAGALQVGGTGSEQVGQTVVMQEEQTGILQAGGTD